MQKTLSVAIAGCGPGGLAAALFLHRAGHRVTLFEQFDTPKPIGSGLLIQPSGQRILEHLGLLDAIAERAAPVTRLKGINQRNGKRALDVEYRHLGESSHALGIHRASLFAVLFDAVKQAGISLRTGQVLSGFELSDTGVSLKFEEGRSEGLFDLLVDASGAHSQLASGKVTQLPFAALWTNVDYPAGSDIAQAALDQRYWDSSRMAGIMPVGINPATGNQGAALFWSIKPGDVDALFAGGIEGWRSAFIDLWPEAREFVAQVPSLDALTLAIYRHRTAAANSGSRVFHIGDAWHCTSPQLGQGANMALIDAAALANAVGYADRFDEIRPYYKNLRSDHVILYQVMSALFTPLYQSDSKLLSAIRDTIIHDFAKWPLVRKLIAKVVSGSLCMPA